MSELNKLFNKPEKEESEDYDFNLTLASEEYYVSKIQCMTCFEDLLETQPVPEATFRKKWGDIYGLAPIRAAKCMKGKGCVCFNGETGTGSDFRVNVWACEGKHWCAVRMKDPHSKVMPDYSIVSIEKTEL